MPVGGSEAADGHAGILGEAVMGREPPSAVEESRHWESSAFERRLTGA